MEQWHHSFRNTLYNAGFKIETLTYTPDENQPDKSAKGVYLNFLLLEDKLIMPTFDDKQNDAQAAEILEHLYMREAIKIEASELAAEGGIINCVTWSGR